MSSSLEAASIERLHTAFLEAFRNNDLAALGEFYTDDAVLLPPARALLTGREAIVAFWQGAERIQDLSFQPTDIRLLGDAVMREVGTLEITSRGQGRQTRATSAKYMSIWLKVDGGWKLESSTWNGTGGGGQRGGRNQGGGGGRNQQGGGGRGQAGGGRGQGGGRGGQGGGGRGGQGGGRGGQNNSQGGGGGPGGGYGQGGSRGQDGYGQGGGRSQGGGGRGQGGGGRGQGGGQGGRRGGGGGGGGAGGGFGPRARQQRANQEAPMIPRIE